jgi:ketosteroid isomerase-like protein
MLLGSIGCSQKLPEEPPHAVVNAYADAFNKKDVEAVLSVYSSAALAEADSAVLSARNMELPYKQAMCMELGIEPEDLEILSGREFFKASLKAAFRRTENIGIEVLDAKIDGTRAIVNARIVAKYTRGGGTKEKEVSLPVCVENGKWKLDSTGLVPGPGPKQGK